MYDATLPAPHDGPNPVDIVTVNNPTCSECRHVFSWRAALVGILGPGRRGSALWGMRCPVCNADLKVPNGRVLLIAASGIFFGSQTSALLVLKALSTTEIWLARMWLIVGFYAIAVFAFLKLEKVE